MPLTDSASQPSMKRQGVATTFDHKLPNSSIFRRFEPNFIPWLQAWNTDSSKWVCTDAKSAVIDHMDFVKDFIDDHPQVYKENEFFKVSERRTSESEMLPVSQEPSRECWQFKKLYIHTLGGDCHLHRRVAFYCSQGEG